MRTLLLLSCLVSSVAIAATWVEVNLSPHQHIEVDEDSIEINGDAIKAWFRENSTQSRKNALGQAYRTLLTLEIFSCQKRISTVERTLYYTAPTEKGRLVNDITFTVTEDDFTTIIPGSIGELKMNKVCEHLQTGK